MAIFVDGGRDFQHQPEIFAMSTDGHRLDMATVLGFQAACITNLETTPAGEEEELAVFIVYNAFTREREVILFWIRRRSATRYTGPSGARRDQGHQGEERRGPDTGPVIAAMCVEEQEEDVYLRPFRVVQEFELESVEVGRQKLTDWMESNWRDVHTGVNWDLVKDDQAVEYLIWMGRFALKSVLDHKPEAIIERPQVNPYTGERSFKQVVTVKGVEKSPFGYVWMFFYELQRGGSGVIAVKGVEHRDSTYVEGPPPPRHDPGGVPQESSIGILGRGAFERPPTSFGGETDKEIARLQQNERRGSRDR